jgi:hypothetical protein
MADERMSSAMTAIAEPTSHLRITKLPSIIKFPVWAQFAMQT